MSLGGCFGSKNKSHTQKEYTMTNSSLMVGIVLVLLIVILYFVYKNAKLKKDNAFEKTLEPLKMVNLDQDAYILQQSTKKKLDAAKKPLESVVTEAKEKVEVVNLDVLSGTEEGTFGEEKKVVQTKKTVNEKSAYKIAKRKVPSHGKISKNDFNEFAGTRILVAEDNFINQRVISGLLAGTGIELIIAEDGQVALDILENDSNFTMVLMDAHMPRVDGFEATRQIRANPKYNHIVVIALSGDTASDDIKKMNEAGMAEHLEKPLRMDTLYDMFYAYTGKDAAQEENMIDEDFITVVMTPELNGNKGLDICGGDENFYREILGAFVSQYGNSATKIQDMMQNNQHKEADKLLLDISGIAANIGADNLKRIAENLKESLQNEQNYFDIFNEYKKHLSALLKDIRTYK